MQRWALRPPFLTSIPIHNDQSTQMRKNPRLFLVFAVHVEHPRRTPSGYFALLEEVRTEDFTGERVMVSEDVDGDALVQRVWVEDERGGRERRGGVDGGC